jgi:hypothetical protein
MNYQKAQATSALTFHTQIGVPAAVAQMFAKIKTNSFPIRETAHAKEQRMRYGKTIFLPASVDLTTAKLIEITACSRSQSLIKFLVRTAYDNINDLCLVIAADGKIITAWFNRKNDNHSTLDHSKYAKPSNWTTHKQNCVFITQKTA